MGTIGKQFVEYIGVDVYFCSRITAIYRNAILAYMSSWCFPFAFQSVFVFVMYFSPSTTAAHPAPAQLPCL